MDYLNVLKKICINSQIFVSLMGTFLAIFFMHEQNVFRLPTAWLIFLTYFSGYLYTKYQDNQIFFFKILIFNSVCGIISAWLIYQNHNEIKLIKWLIIVVMGLLYNSKFLNKIVRNIPLFKIFYVGTVWALVNSWLIIPGFSTPIFWSSFLFVSALVLPFDIRDMQKDKIITFPQLIGVEKTKFLAYILLFASSVLLTFATNIMFAVSFFLAVVIAIVFVYFSQPYRKDFFFTIGVEMCTGLPLFFLWIITNFGK